MKKRDFATQFLVTLSCFSLITACCSGEGEASAEAQSTYVSQVWVSDQGDGTFKNPVLHADYSDPDIIRVGDDYFMTSSSFQVLPALPILHSKDLINWKLVNHAVKNFYMEGVEPANFYDYNQHGRGVWAPCIRYHNGEYMIYWGDPDFGIYVVKTKDPFAEWDKPICVIPGQGRIDPSPLFDDDGKVYLSFAWASGRSHMNTLLNVVELNEDGTKAIGQEVLVYDGLPNGDLAVEGTKFMKKDGYYYIMAPAGGVDQGWQLALRSKSVYGPYEVERVLAIGSTDINGPHQGGLVETQTGEWWFMHFQEKGVSGRINHLQKVEWRDGWPVMGINAKGYCGEPALSYPKPNVGATYPIETPVDSDEFNEPSLGLQWQWHGNPQSTWAYPSSEGYLRLYGQFPPEEYKNLWSVPNLLLQKFPAPEFMATMKSKIVIRNLNDKVAMVAMGRSYSYLSVEMNDKGDYILKHIICDGAFRGKPERVAAEVTLPKLEALPLRYFSSNFEEVELYFRLKIYEDGQGEFLYSLDGEEFLAIGEKFSASKGHWIGAKMGMFVLNEKRGSWRSWADVDYFRVESL